MSANAPIVAECANAKHDSKLNNKGIVEGEVDDKWIVEECEDRLLVHDFDIRASALPFQLYAG